MLRFYNSKWYIINNSKYSLENKTNENTTQTDKRIKNIEFDKK